MSTNPEQFTPQTERPPVPETPAATVIAPLGSTMVHDRGGVSETVQMSTSEKGSDEPATKQADLPEKGDIYIHPDPATEARRLVIEGVRKDGDGGTIISFTPESQPGVRTEPGKKIRQLPLRNFQVKSDGYEPKRIYKERLNQTAEEFGEIWNASQELLVKVLAQGDNEEDSDDAKQEKDRVIELLQKIGSLEDEWDALGEDESRAKYAGALSLLKRSKKLVGELPESLVASNLLLRKIHREYQVKEDDYEEEVGVQKKKIKKGKGLGVESGDKGKVKLDLSSKRGRKTQGVMEVPDISRSEAGENRPEVGSTAVETENEQREAELKFWTDDIRVQQRERETLNARILERDLTNLWGEAMKAADPDLEKFARKSFRDIDGHIVDIWQQYAEWRAQLQRERTSVAHLKRLEEFDQWLEKSLDTLMKYSKQYQVMLEIGRKVLKENRGQKPKSFQEKQAHESGSQQKRGRGRPQNRGRRAERSSLAEIASHNLQEVLHQLPKPVQGALRTGLDELEGIKEQHVAAMRTVLDKAGIVPAAQDSIILEALAGDFNEEVGRVLGKVGIRTTPTTLETIKQKWLTNQTPQIEYGGE